LKLPHKKPISISMKLLEKKKHDYKIRNSTSNVPWRKT